MMPLPGVTVVKGDIRNAYDDYEEEEVDDSTEAYLTEAVDLLRKASNFLAYFHTNNEQHQLLGEKACTNLEEIIMEVDGFVDQWID